MSGFSDERRIDRGAGQSRQDAIEGRDSRLDKAETDVFRFIAPALVAATSAKLAALSLDSSRSRFTRFAAGAGSLVSGALVLGAVFAEIKGDN
jgi:hypothetical protein